MRRVLKRGALKRGVFGLLVAGTSMAPSLARAQGSTTAADSSAPAASAVYRDPQTARRLGALLPGAGHVYAGEYLRGYLAGAGTAGSLGMAVIVYNVGDCTFLNAEPCEPRPQWQRVAAAAVAAGLAAWVWVTSARDAPRAAERANERRRRLARVAPLITPGIASGSDWRAGVSIGW